MSIDGMDIPSTWEWITAEVACGSVRDGTHDTPQYIEDGIPLVTSKNLIDGNICFKKTKSISLEDHNEISKRSGVENGDILFAMIGTIGNPVVVNTSKVFSIKNVALFKRNEDCISPKYLKYWLESSSFDKWLKPRLRGTTQKFAPLGLLRSLPIPVAPANKQKRIVAEIENQFSRLDEAVANLKRVKANLKRYKAAVLKAAVEGKLTEEWRKQHPDVEPADKLLERILAERRENWQGRGKYKEPAAPDTTDLSELPVGWVWVSVEMLAQVGTGATPLRSRQAYYKNGNVPWVTSGALNDEYVSSANENITDLAVNETNAKRFPVHTLLVAMYGEGKTRGKVSELLIEAATNQACAAIVMSGLAEKVREYIKMFFLKNYEDIRRLSSGGVQPNLNLSHIKQTKIPFPSLSEQYQIVAEVERRLSIVTGAEAQVDANLRRVDRLRQSILKQAFSGQLVVDT